MSPRKRWDVPCLAAGCPNKVAARGLCMKHYLAARRHGTLDNYARAKGTWHVVCGRCGAHCGTLTRPDDPPWPLIDAHTRTAHTRRRT